MIKSEMETVIRFDMESATAIIWTASSTVQRQLEKLHIRGRQIGPGLQFEIPKKWVRIRKPRQVSEEQREAMRQRAHSRGFGAVRTRVRAAEAENASPCTSPA